MEKLIDEELERIKFEMEKALKDANELVEKMGDFLGQSENEVKTFLEESKGKVHHLSMPYQLQATTKLEKEVFDS